MFIILEWFLCLLFNILIYIYIYEIVFGRETKKKKKFVDDLGKWIKLDSVFDLQKNL